MAIGPVVGALAKMAAPRLASAAVEGGARAAVGMVAGRAVSRGLASVPGQRLAGRVAGERVAGALASKSGQKAVSYYTSRETRQALKPDEAKPAPMPTTPVQQQDVNPNLIGAPDTPVGRRQRQQGWQDNGTMGSKFGNGAGWWNAATITDPMQAGYDWRSLSDTSVARGPASWNMVGKGIGHRMAGRAREFADGYAGAKPEQTQPYKHGPEEIAQINENIASTWPAPQPTQPSHPMPQYPEATSKLWLPNRSGHFQIGVDEGV